MQRWDWLTTIWSVNDPDALQGQNFLPEDVTGLCWFSEWSGCNIPVNKRHISKSLKTWNNIPLKSSSEVTLFVQTDLWRQIFFYQAPVYNKRELISLLCCSSAAHTLHYYFPTLRLGRCQMNNSLLASSVVSPPRHAFSCALWSRTV